MFVVSVGVMESPVWVVINLLILLVLIVLKEISPQRVGVVTEFHLVRQQIYVAFVVEMVPLVLILVKIIPSVGLVF